MNFSRIPLGEAEGAILAHGVRLDGGVFKKGRRLSADDIAALRAAGVDAVMAARLGVGDMDEDLAATTLATAAQGPGTATAAAFTGRCNLYAECAGLAVIDTARVDEINLLDEALTVATVPAFEAVAPRRMVATVKVIPFAAPEAVVRAAADIARAGGPLVRVAPFKAMAVGLVLTRLPGTKETVLDNTVKTVRARLAAIGSELAGESRIDHGEDAIAAAVRAELAAGRDLVLVSGASAITDRRDVVPAGIEAAGGVVDHFGMPVDPGNLLLLGHFERAGATVPVIGMPGCARSPKLNGFDWVLRRLAAGIPVTRRDIMLMGAGGLLKEFAGRPQPRDEPVAAARQAPRIAALVLAAGQSRRMGATNKLLIDIDGAPMVRRVVETVLASRARPVIVVTGHQGDAVRDALDGLDIAFIDNPDYTEGLSASLRHGLGALAKRRNIDGALVCLGDMPEVGAAHLDKLIAAFDPLEGRAICVPTHNGKRGNPVLWASRFFAEIVAVAGDVGARHLIGDYAELACEVELADGGVLVDIDTPEALSEFQAARSA